MFAWIEAPDTGPKELVCVELVLQVALGEDFLATVDGHPVVPAGKVAVVLSVEAVRGI
jgi:hypothetical protein